MAYTAKTFSLPELEGISAEQIKVHLALYEGYVKHVNLIQDQLTRAREGSLTLDPYVQAEVRRRLAFEFCGMRMHEYYFEQLTSRSEASPTSALAKAATEKYGSNESFVAHIKEVAQTRGIGWVVVWWDAIGGMLHTTFVGDHELGQLAGLPVILALDMWEHAYMVDYRPSDKGKYVEAFLDNLDWSVVEGRFDAAIAASAA